MIQTKARHESSSTLADIILACVFVSSVFCGEGRASCLGASVFAPLQPTRSCTGLPPPDRSLAVSTIEDDASVMLQRTEFPSRLWFVRYQELFEGRDKTPEGLDAVLVSVDGATYLPTINIYAARYNVSFRNYGQSYLLER